MDKILCIKLYKEAFPEPDIPFETALFEDCFKHCRYIKENGKIISMLFALPCEIITESGIQKCIYIYAAATDKEFRNCGYMANLIEQLKQTNIPLLLRPANDRLIAFYEKLGFKTVTAQKSNALPYVCPTEGFKLLIQKFPDEETNEKFTAMYYGEICSDKINFIYTME